MWFKIPHAASVFGLLSTMTTFCPLESRFSEILTGKLWYGFLMENTKRYDLGILRTWTLEYKAMQSLGLLALFACAPCNGGSTGMQRRFVFKIQTQRKINNEMQIWLMSYWVLSTLLQVLSVPHTIWYSGCKVLNIMSTYKPALVLLVLIETNLGARAVLSFQGQDDTHWTWLNCVHLSCRLASVFVLH